MISFKEAIARWEFPLWERMIGYSALTRKACITPDRIFVIRYWNERDEESYRMFDVGLIKLNGRWVVDLDKFNSAMAEKIRVAEENIRKGRSDIKIRYPAVQTD